MSNQLSVTIVITTKNRKEELGKCIDSCILLKGVDEILVFDDGSTDHTFEFVKACYPQIALFRSEQSLGLINARTKCAGLASGDILVSIDDDCCFDGAETIIDVIKYFSHSKIAAITIPAIDVLKSDSITQEGVGDLNEVFICSQYRGCAHAIRKDVFLSLGGYWDILVRQEEETEIAMRLYNAGYVIRVANSIKPILHYHSNIRNPYQIAFYRSRNKFLVKYKYAPLVLLPLELFIQIVSLINYEIKEKQLRACLMGFKDAIRNIFHGKISRNQMQFSTYLSYKKLRLRKNTCIVLSNGSPIF